jgi:hypothetical protein
MQLGRLKMQGLNSHNCIIISVKIEENQVVNTNVACFEIMYDIQSMDYRDARA